MASSNGNKNIEICKTQDGVMPVFGNLPVTSTVKPGMKPIFVGSKAMIPRWDVHSANPCILNYYLQASTFGNTANAELAKNLLQQAAELWNGVGFGVVLQAATDPAKAHFDVVYDKNGNEGAPAMAFFPSHVDKLYLYPEAFDIPEIKKQLLNTVTHEFGHILGLRHEHAPKEKLSFVQIGEKNDSSIMSYNLAKRSLQQSDRDGIKKFYSYKNGDHLDNMPIVDFMPQFVQRN